METSIYKELYDVGLLPLLDLIFSQLILSKFKLLVKEYLLHLYLSLSTSFGQLPELSVSVFLSVKWG